MCGENNGDLATASNWQGSPPRVRGKPLCVCPCGVLMGITPACAGKTSSHTSSTTCSKDHPRVCGENFLKTVPAASATGSPPRVRGKQRTRRVKRSSSRITPACAGKTLCAHPAGRGSQDHPRVCGENNWYNRGERLPLGSPPRVRGKLIESSLPKHDIRITPACAGKTPCPDVVCFAG